MRESGSSTIDATTQSILEHWYRVAPNDRLAHLVRDASRGLTRALQLRLSEYDISFGHWALLRILWAEDGLSQRELSIRAGVMEPTTHTTLNRMETLGLITRRHHAGNKRRLHVHLTRAGRTLQASLEPLAEEVNMVAVGGLSDSEVEVVRHVLLTVITNLAEDEAAAAERGLKIQSTRDLGQRVEKAGQ